MPLGHQTRVRAPVDTRSVRLRPLSNWSPDYEGDGGDALDLEGLRNDVAHATVVDPPERRKEKPHKLATFSFLVLPSTLLCIEPCLA